MISVNLQLRKRQLGFSEGQMIGSIVLLQSIVGACPQDTRLLADDPCLERGLNCDAKMAAVDFNPRNRSQTAIPIFPKRHASRSDD
jgi:hypothetical protein